MVLRLSPEYQLELGLHLHPASAGRGTRTPTSMTRHWLQRWTADFWVRYMQTSPSLYLSLRDYILRSVHRLVSPVQVYITHRLYTRIPHAWPSVISDSDRPYSSASK